MFVWDWRWRHVRAFLELTIHRVDQVGELDEVLEDWVLIHVVGHLEDYSINLLEAAKRVHWTSISLRGLEEVLSSWVLPLVRVLSWTTSSSARCWRIPQLSVWSLGMLLLHMSIKCGIGKICFVTVLAFKVSASVVVL